MFTRKGIATSVSGKTANGCPVRRQSRRITWILIFSPSVDGETLRVFPVRLAAGIPGCIAQLAGGCGRNLVHTRSLPPYPAALFELCQNGRLVNYRIRCLPDQQQPGFVLRFLPELERAHARHRRSSCPIILPWTSAPSCPRSRSSSPLDMRE